MYIEILLLVMGTGVTEVLMQFVVYSSFCFQHSTFYSQEGVSPLLFAAGKGHVDVVQSLLQNEATVDLKTNVRVNVRMKTIVSVGN